MSASAPGAGSAQWLLTLEGVSVGFETRCVLSNIDLGIPSRGITGVLGPAGVGKSTLLRTLARRNEALPSFWLRGSVRWRDGSDFFALPVDDAHRVVPLLAQKAGLYTATVLENAIAGMRGSSALTRVQKLALARRALEPVGLWELYQDVLSEPVLSLSIGRQRLLSIARLIAGGAECLLADEPLRDIDPDDAKSITSLMRAWSRDHAVVMVTHDQRIARDLCDNVCLLAAGEVVEISGGGEFFSAPRTTLAAQFVRSGNCWPIAKNSLPYDAPPMPGPLPGGFHWVMDGLLGGMQQPGLLNSERDDLEALRLLGCHHLINLTEVDQGQRAATLGFEWLHFPIPDMGAPELADAAALCERVSGWIDAGQATVMHCRAGLGRTGTMLACTLVYRGRSAVSAIDEVRVVNPYYIQSVAQLAFVAEFERYQNSPGNRNGISSSRDRAHGD